MYGHDDIKLNFPYNKIRHGGCLSPQRKTVNMSESGLMVSCLQSIYRGESCFRSAISKGVI
jgi:hypothetical protein